MGFRDKPTTAPAAKPAPTKPVAAAKPAASAARPAAAAKTPPRPAGSRYTGLPVAQQRAPFLEPGDHRVKFLKTSEVRTKSKKPWLKIELEIVSSTTLPPGVTRSIRKVITDEAFEMSGPEILSMTIAACGFVPDEEGQAQFEEQNEDWPLMLNAVHGLADGIAVHGENPLKDMLAKVNCVGTTKTYDDGSEKEFGNYNWMPDDEVDFELAS